MKKAQTIFIEAYIVNFLASYGAANYAHYCIHGWDKFRYPAHEDIVGLARKAWNELQGYILPED